MPYVAQVASAKLDKLRVFGGDYPADGTGIRDYIHVMDLAKGHLKALGILTQEHGCRAYNLGTGRGYSVLDVVNTFATVNGCKIPYEIVGRRPGNVPACYADPSYSAQQLQWKAKLGLAEMVRDHWNWQKQNPKGSLIKSALLLDPCSDAVRLLTPCAGAKDEHACFKSLFSSGSTDLLTARG